MASRRSRGRRSHKGAETRQPERSVSLISLGCAKNLTLSEEILGLFGNGGFAISPEPSMADIVIVNTCGFIELARAESDEFITKLCKLRKVGSIEYLVVYGCMVQGFGEEMKQRFSEVDLWVGSTAPDKLYSLVKGNNVGTWIPMDWHSSAGRRAPKLSLTPPSYSYIRVSDGCDNRCAYCSIPRLRGPLRSRQPTAVVKDVKDAVAQGKSEIILIGQDLAAYGADRGKGGLEKLVDRVTKVKGVQWVRLLYLHPVNITEGICRMFAENELVVPYADVPVQHLVDSILKRMGRRTTFEDIAGVFNSLREARPDIALRTSIITGFPGETDEDFELLLERLEILDPDHVGAFVYSPEPDTAAFEFEDDVPADVKEARRAKVMEDAQKRAFALNIERVGDVYTVITDSTAFTEDGEVSCCRSEYEAPEVDGLIYVKPVIQPGEFADVEILAADGYDLVGRPVSADPDEPEKLDDH
ncbi:MAG: 30S ribosomal protein S12 methylthiotransferase RimO [Planctomycetota bacterium]|nr:30S ribosomal protein S12 methylthiotransferase RimO [Planctomycetota bacterium]